MVVTAEVYDAATGQPVDLTEVVANMKVASMVAPQAIDVDPVVTTPPDAAARPPPTKDVILEVDPDLGKTYKWRGKTYREKVTNDVNSFHALEDMYEHVVRWLEHRWGEPRFVEADTPYQIVEDYVNTLRQASRDGTGSVQFPSQRYGMDIALHHLPVGHMVSIKNAQMIPPRFDNKHGQVEYTVLELYHGTSAHAAPGIMGQGFLPTLGVGCDAFEQQYGSPIPSVYVAKSWQVASTYPTKETTGPIP